MYLWLLVGLLKGRPINIKTYFKALFEFVKVGIALVILFGSNAGLPGKL